MEKLQALILYFISNFPRTLVRTELVKIVYYFEYCHFKFYGNQYTNVRFVRDYRGPFSWDIPDAVDSMNGLIAVQTYQTYFGTEGYKHYIRDEARAEEFIANLPDYVFQLAEEVVSLFSDKTYSEFLDIVYDTPPMETILEKEKNCGGKLLGRDVNMASKTGIYKPGKAKLKAAKQRLNLSSRGSDEEYHCHFTKEIEKFKDVRRRASKCLLS